MKLLGTFLDNELKIEYDLYSINARQIKEWLDEKYPLSLLKLALFNDETRIREYIERLGPDEIKEMKLDIETGYVEKEYFNDKSGYRTDNFKQQIENVNLNEIENKKHLMGYELMPMALIVKDKDLTNREQFYLLDGFRRMYYVNEIPDVDVLVKVYDILTPAQWQSAMLLFNSWKIVSKGGMYEKSFDLYVDRGYKYGLYTYFGIDLTMHHHNCLKYFESYVDRRFYSRLKNNGLAHIDLKLCVDLFYKYSSQGLMFYNQRDRGVRSSNYDYVFCELMKILGRFREIAYLTNRQEFSTELTIESVENFLQEKSIQKHIEKILTMQVGGFIENYVEKNLLFDMINFIRKELGYSQIDKKFKSYKHCFNKYSWEEYADFTNEQLDKKKQEQDEKYLSIKNKQISY